MDKQTKNTGLNYEEVVTEEKINELGSALTWIGLVLDEKNINDVFDWIERYTPMKQRKCYLIKGSTMNKLYDAGYPPDLNLIAVDLNDMEDFDKIILRRFEVGGRWLDDVIANLKIDA